jgi:hypothetical protein
VNCTADTSYGSAARIGGNIRECPLRLGLWAPTINTER